MERKEYWNQEYTKYWQETTADANKAGEVSQVGKLTAGDCKAPGEEVAIRLFDGLTYRKTERLLDYGCGFGRFYPYFSSVSDYYGIDISKAMVDECIRRFPQSAERFTVAEGEKLPFSDGFFDKVICYGVFDACYQETALEEMLRVVCKGGMVLLTGKHTNYFEDDRQAYAAEEAARKKGHPNYFTEVGNMKSQVGPYVKIIQERYYERRGDFAKEKYVEKMPRIFYEWALVFQKTEDLEVRMEPFCEPYSTTWKRVQGA